MSDHHPPPADPRTARETGRRRARAITAGLATAAVVGTGAVAVVAAVGNADNSSAATSTTSASSTSSSSTDQQSWSPSGATVTQGSDGAGVATSGGT